MKDIITYRFTFRYLCFAFSILEPPETNLTRKARLHGKSMACHVNKFILYSENLKKWAS